MEEKKEILQIPFRETVDPLTEIQMVLDCPIDGKMTDVYMHFPAGCASLVEIAVDYEGMRVVPRTAPAAYIALDDATIKFDCDCPIEKGKQIAVTVRNFDDMYEHTPSIIVVLRR